MRYTNIFAVRLDLLKQGGGSSKPDRRRRKTAKNLFVMFLWLYTAFRNNFTKNKQTKKVFWTSKILCIQIIRLLETYFCNRVRLIFCMILSMGQATRFSLCLCQIRSFYCRYTFINDFQF